jgi:hypothetical protein
MIAPKSAWRLDPRRGAPVAFGNETAFRNEGA